LVGYTVPAGIGNADLRLSHSLANICDPALGKNHKILRLRA
jgi:hypothetical protein